jgi:hypothetical protein
MGYALLLKVFHIADSEDFVPTEGKIFRDMPKLTWEILMNKKEAH